MSIIGKQAEASTRHLRLFWQHQQLGVIQDLQSLLQAPQRNLDQLQIDILRRNNDVFLCWSRFFVTGGIQFARELCKVPNRGLHSHSFETRTKFAKLTALLQASV